MHGIAVVRLYQTAEPANWHSQCAVVLPVINMSKSCCFAVVLAVVCLSVILLSLEADAHPIADESSPWSAATLEVRIIPSNQQQQNGKIKESCEEANETTTLEEVVNMVKVIALNQQENAKEIRDLKRLFESGNTKTNETSLDAVVKEMKDEIKEVKRLLTSNDKDCETVRPQTSNLTTQPTDVTAQPTPQPTSALDYVTVNASKEALVAALVCEYLVCL